MKGKYAKTSHGSVQKEGPQIGVAILVAGEHRSCKCGFVVRKGIMYEYENILYCSRRCVASVMKEHN